MRVKLLMMIVMDLLLLGYCLYRIWPSRQQVEDAIIHMYVKIVCER